MNPYQSTINHYKFTMNPLFSSIASHPESQVTPAPSFRQRFQVIHMARLCGSRQADDGHDLRRKEGWALGSFPSKYTLWFRDLLGFTNYKS